MEREGRTISIEPYIEQGGIMGAQIALNPKAAESIIKRTVLRRDIKITKGYEREIHQTVGSEELAIVKSKAENLTQSEIQSKNATILKTGKDWIIAIHDQQIADKTDDWMRYHYKPDKDKNGHELFKQKFTNELSMVSVDQIRRAFWDEKKNIAYTSLLKCTRLFAPLVLSGFALYEITWATIDMWKHLIALNQYFPTDTFFHLAKGVPSIYASDLVLRFSKILLDKTSPADSLLLKPHEILIPSLPVTSTIAGSISLALNSEKLITLKKEEE